MWANWTAIPQYSGPAVAFFDVAEKPALPLLLGLGLDRCHTYKDGARNPRIAARMALTMAPVTATSASSKVIARA